MSICNHVYIGFDCYLGHPSYLGWDKLSILVLEYVKLG
jgi:hypothetical protein